MAIDATIIQQPLQNLISAVITFIPRLVGAIIILIIGWIIGRLVGSAVKTIADRAELDRLTLDTPLGDMMGGTEESVSRTIGKIAKWFIYAITFLAAADVLAIELLSQWISRAVSYVPAFFAGLFVILFGFILADFLGDLIMRTEAATRTHYTAYFADGVRVFLYFTAIVIGLDTMGINVQFLYIFARAITWGLAAALALGVGIAVGWGAKDYVADHIGDWLRRGKQETQR